MKKNFSQELKKFASLAQSARDKYSCTKRVNGQRNLELRIYVFFRLKNGAGFGIQTLDFSFYPC